MSSHVTDQPASPAPQQPAVWPATITTVLMVVIILLVALTLRMNYMTSFDWRHFEYAGDSGHHYNLARNLARGQGQVTDFIFAYWFRHPSLPAVSDFYPPGYHSLVAVGFKLLGESILTARLVSLAMGLAGVAAAFALGATLFGRPAGIVAAALLALNPVHIQHSVAIMTDATLTTLILVSAWLSVEAFQRNRLGLAGAAGLAGGWAFITKSVAVALPPTIALLALLAVRRRQMPPRRAVVLLTIAAVGFVAPTVPWAMRTWDYFGKPFYSLGNFTPICTDWSRMTYETEPPTLGTYLRETPLRYVLYTRAHHVEQSLRGGPRLLALGLAEVVLVAAGAWLARRRGAWLPLVLAMLYYSTILIAAGNDHYWRERYLLPVIALLAPLAGVAVTAALLRLPAPRQPMALGVALALLLGGGSLLIDVPAPPQDRARNVALVQLGEWVRRNTPRDAVVMGKFVQDMTYYMDRRTVMDPHRIAMELIRSGSEKRDPALFRERSLQEVRYYGVSFVMIDPEPGSISAEEILRGFEGLPLTPVYRDPGYPIALYRIDGVPVQHLRP